MPLRSNRLRTPVLRHLLRCAHLGLLGVALGLLAAACATAAPSRLSQVSPDSLYVASALDGTLILLDGASGRTLGPPLPAGPAPQQAVVGPNGAALVLSGDHANASGLIYAARVGTGWQTRPVPLEPGARVVLLAGDGSGYAAAVYLPAGSATGDQGADPGRSRPACRLALIDLRRGAVEQTHTVCTPRDLPTGLAIETTTAGPIAYLALWSRAAQAEGAFLPAGAHIVAVQARTGAPVAEASLSGLPRPAAAGGSLVLAPGPDGSGRRLYCVEAMPGSELGSWNEEEYGWQFSLSGAWHLLRLTVEPLAPEWTLRLTFAAAGLRVAPDGAQAYSFDARSEGLWQIDLTTGQMAPLARVPGYSPNGLAATRDRLYVASPAANQVWVFDRQRGRRVQVIPVGRRPVWIGPVTIAT